MLVPSRCTLWGLRPVGVTILLFSGIFLGGCGGEDGGQGEGGGAAAAEEERSVIAEELQAEEEAAENLVFRPLELPPADFTGAPSETEPNDEAETATPLGPDLMVRGTFEDRDYDYYTFTTEGEPQLYAVEASGENISYVEYSDLSGDRDLRRDAEDGTASLTNLYLPPGRHLLSVRGETGPYTLRVVPLGPPDPYAEMEPNDEESRAHLLRVGRSRLGYLTEESDQDYYRFSLRNGEHLRLLVSPPPDLVIRAVLSGGEGQIADLQGGEAGDSIVYEIELPMGEYHVRLVPRGASAARLPYRIRLDRLDPYALPTDLEPNDEVMWARPMPANQVFRGELGVGGDSDDWYRLPLSSEPVDLVVEPLDMPEDRPLNRFVSVRRRNGNRFESVEWNDADSILEGTLPADSAAFIRVSGEGAYAFRVRLDPGPEPTPEAPAAEVEASLPRGPHVFAAFWPERQRMEVPVELRNSSPQETTLSLSVASSDARWNGSLPAGTITLGPNESRSVPLSVEVPEDAWGDHPVTVTLRAMAPNGGFATASTELLAVCEAPPVNPSLPEPLPSPLLGGINVASSAFGARPASDNEDYNSRDAVLLDGFIPSNQEWYARLDLLPRDVVVDLAGEEAVPIAAAVLNPTGTEDGWRRVRDFELWLSEDGRDYELALEGSLTREPADQVFSLPEPVPARFAKLRVLRAQSEAEHAYMADFKLVAPPGSTAGERAGVNIADPAVGGYVVWSRPLVSDPEDPPLLLDDGDVERSYLDTMNPNEWVIGFHHDRAARIRRLEWTQPEGDDYTFIKQAQVAVSTGSPLGPWTPLGTLTLDPSSGATTVMDLPEPVWARYVRLSVTGPERREQWYLPEAVRIFEQPTVDGYRSILGEWGTYAKSAAFERHLATEGRARTQGETDDNDTRERAQDLPAGVPLAGSVQVGEDTDWYRLEVPSSDNRVRLELRGSPSLRTRLRLEDQAGVEVTLVVAQEPDPGVHVIYEAEVGGGGRYFLKVEEPPRSIAMVWDNSGSISPFKETLYPSILGFSKDVLPGLEFVNLLVFKDSPEFLLEDWSDDAYELQRALTEYDRKDGSSDAEANLLYTVNGMRDREGTKAIVFLTDAESGGFSKSGDLWEALSVVRPSIFTVEMHHGDVRHHQDLMQSWASVNAGKYDFFRTGADLGVAFQRATCMIRRPARYELSVTTRFEEPPLPGFIAVDPGELDLNAVELILDASGSMLQRMEGRRRIEIARDVLSDLVSQTIPEGTPLALRIFGHKTPDACDTDLEIPVQPLDRERVTGIIRSTEAMNLAKTPIGESLSLVAEDLQDVSGQKLIMLITDGEETCEGDPAAAIRGLKEAGHDVRVNIVGFAIDDEGLKSQFESWAREGGGLYFNASSSQELAEAVDRALRPKFQILSESGEVLGEGTAGLDTVEVPVGTYTVRILTSPLRAVPGVQVRSEQTTTVGPGAAGGEA